MALTREGNVYFDSQEPWKVVKTDEARAVRL